MTVCSSGVAQSDQEQIDNGAASASVLGYLRAVVAASECLLAEADLLRGVESALDALRAHTRFDRVYVFRDVPGAGGLALLGESHGPLVLSARSQVGDGLLTDEAFPEVIPPLRAGLTYSSTKPQRTGSNAELTDATGTRSDLMVPIVVKDRFWGIVGFDDCKSEHGWTTAEIAALQGAASAIAAAVLRDAAATAQAEHMAALAMRDRLLDAVAKSMPDLLGNEGGAFDDAVRATLGTLGEACGIHRVKVIMQRPASENSEPTHFLDYEWWAPGFASQTSLGLTRFPNSLIPEWMAALESGRAIWFLIGEVPIQLRAAFASVGVQSSGAVPIFGAGKYLGCIAFDDCADQRSWSPAEIDALTVAARTLGSAIHRQALQQAMLEERDHRIELKRQRAEDAEAANAQLRRRDALLDAVAQMSRELLQIGDWVHALPSGLQRLGEAVGIQHVVLFQEVDGLRDNADRIVAEWCAEGVAAHGLRGITAFPDMAATVFTAKLHGGEAVWGRADEFQGGVRDTFKSLGVVSIGVVPIIVAGGYWGAIRFDDCLHARAWDAAEIDSLSSAANAVAAAIGRQQAEDDRLAAERSRADALRKANDELIASMSRLVALKDLPAFMGQLLLALARTCGARVGSLLDFDGVDGRLWMRHCVIDGALVDVQTDARLTLWRQPVPDLAVDEWRSNLAGRVLAYQPVPLTADGAVWPENLHWHWKMGHQLRLHFPLNIGGQLVGIAGLLLNTGDRLDDFQLQQAVVLAQQAAIAMQMERLARLVERSAVQVERERMAAEIHDNLAQSFTSIAMQSESLAGLMAGDQEKSRVLRLIERTAREGLAEARMSVLALSPADGWPGSLDQSLEALAERSSIRGGFECRFESSGKPCAMPGPVQESLLRIAQEATSNAMRHSGGTRVSIRLDYVRQRLQLTIEDDGRGLLSVEGQRQSGGFGVSGMESRAAAIGGSLRLGPSSLGGLAVHVDAPCHGSGDLAP